MEKMNTTKRSLKKDEKAVSPVIGVIMMIAIVVIIAAVVAAFAYGIIGGVNKAPSAALVVEGAESNTPANVTIFHHGGDTITGAFKPEQSATFDKWAYLQIRVNGAIVNKTVPTGKYVEALTLNDVASNSTTPWPENFEPGDQMDISFASLSPGDVIIILHTPSDSILQRITIT